LINDQSKLTDEAIENVTTGIIKQNKQWVCQQCHTSRPEHFYSYYAPMLNKKVVYCRNCISLGRMDNINQIVITKSKRNISQGIYQLSFQLSEQQLFASTAILNALKHFDSKVLYAVTGAGKTEMIFEAISYARQQGYNVAIVSPRVDVVIEVGLRIQDAFKQEQIDILYQGQPQRYNGHFVVATVHQLYRFKCHFDFVIVDEVDAFPLTMDPTLMDAIKHASKQRYCHIFMTATPPKALLQKMKPEHIITLSARFHRHPLPVPQFKYFKLKPHTMQCRISNLFKQQIDKRRYTLVFFDNIKLMKSCYSIYKTQFEHLAYVYSEDTLRFEKVNDLRLGKYQIVFTTTILERGFTMAHLDVIVFRSQNFESSALVQIAGRVGRKREAPNGRVLFLHEGITIKMLKARRDIMHMNRLAMEKGWIDA